MYYTSSIYNAAAFIDVTSNSRAHYRRQTTSCAIGKFSATLTDFAHFNALQN